MPKASIIVPVYNVEAYLAQCIDSLRAQSLTDMEILLVNDASTDGSLLIAREYEKKDARIRVIDKPHGGLGDTRNWGARAATGEYLLFVDSDDWLDKNALEELCRAAEQAGADLTVFNYVRENTADGESRVCALPLSYPDASAETAETVLAALIGPDAGSTPWRGVEMLGCAWRRLYRRAWFAEHEFSYPREQEVMLEDLPVSIQAHYRAGRVLFVEGAYYHYRYNPDSLSTRYRAGKIEMLTKCFEMVQAFLEEQGVYARYEQRHLAWFLRMAAHSALVNCFSPKNPAGAKGKRQEVRGILRNPVLRKAAASRYLSGGTRADKLLLFVLRSGSVPLVYLFYQQYTKMLMRDGKKK